MYIKCHKAEFQFQGRKTMSILTCKFIFCSKILVRGDVAEMKRRNIFILGLIMIVTLASLYMLYLLNYIPHKRYSNEYFGIETYRSTIDEDGDGIDDQTDILVNVREYIATKPKYKSKYYGTGYPNDGYGTCTDVVAFGLKGAGYDLMELVNEHIESNRDTYGLDIVDKKIDFRRVKNLKIYFEHNAKILTTDLRKIEEWQGGDIVVFKDHIGIISDQRNKNGVPFIIHHGGLHYEEDILEYKADIVGHYRVS